jgi:thiol-disulfide isomerase/thioredoxin
MKTNNLLYTLFVLLFSQQVFAQTANSGGQFTLKARLSGAHADTVFIRYASDTGKNVFESKPVVNNEFTITGSISQPVNATISFKTNGEAVSEKSYWESTKEVYLEQGELTLKGDPSNVPALTLTGSKTQLELDELNGQTTDIHKAMNQLNHQFDQYLKEKNKEKIAETHVKYQNCQDKEKDIDYKFFLAHPNSYLTANKILSYIEVMGIDSIKQVYNNYNAEIKATHIGGKLAAEINKIEMGAGTPGIIAPTFTANDLNGKPLSLGDFRGKYLILDFWASWCVPCRKGNPHMIVLYNTYKGKGLDIIGVSDDGTNAKAWKNAVVQDNIGIWRHVIGNPNYNRNDPNDIDKKYGIRILPTKILIDPSGKIIGRFGDNLGSTDEDLDKMLASIFNK